MAGVVPPVPASDVEEDPFGEEPMENPFSAAEPASAGAAWQGLFDAGGEEEATFVPQVPSSALDHRPPEIDGQRLGAARMAQFTIQRELDRAAKPLLEKLGPSFEQLSKLGYNKPNVDPAGEQLQSILRKLVRNY